MAGSLRRVLAAYALGALLGTIPLFLDWALRGGAITQRTLAGFTLLGGVAAVLSRLVAVVSRRRGCEIQTAVAVFALFLVLQVLYLVNVGLLPNQRALARVSIVWDLVTVGAAVACAWLALRARGRLASVFGGGLLPIAGSVLLVAAVAEVVETWPVEPEVPHRRGNGPNLLLIVIDAARRDHLGIHGYALATSPTLDAWAARARVYDRALAASSWTLNDVPVMLGSRTGRPGDHPVLEKLKSAGYVVTCFSDNPLLERDGPLSRGFDHVGQSTSAPLRMLRSLYAETFVGEHVILWPWLAREWSDRRLVDQALRWRERAEGPFLLYVHLMDVHMPYRRPGIDGRGWSQRRLESPQSGASMTAEEAADVVAHYDGGLRSADEAAGRLLRAAEGWGRPYLAIVTADHGESLGEGSRWGHGKTVSPELLDVPLLVIGDGVQPGRVTEPVGHASVAATLLRAAGVEDAGIGSDLRTSDGDVVVEGSLPPRWRYRGAGGYLAVTDALAGDTKLFDIHLDPHREHDLSRLHHELARELAADRSNGASESPAAGTIQRLRALGYIDD